MKILFLAVFCLIPQLAFAEKDIVQCSENNGSILCNLQLAEFIEQTRGLLTNGWENTLQIHIALLNSDGSSVVARSRLEATQRCYLDPFESPCLILWTGATKWQRYRDENVFLRALSHFSIQALTLSELPADNYIVRVTIQVMPSASRRIQSINSWFKSTSGDSGMSTWSSNSLIGAMLSSHASSVGSDIYQKTIETSQFYIDLDFDRNAEEEADDVEENSENASEMTGSESSESMTSAQPEATDAV